MSTAHLVPTESSSADSAADARSDGSRMPGSRLGRAHATAAQRHAESSSAGRRRAAMACAVRGEEGEKREKKASRVGGWSWFNSPLGERRGGVFVGVREESFQRFLLLAPFWWDPHGSDISEFPTETTNILHGVAPNQLIPLSHFIYFDYCSFKIQNPREGSALFDFKQKRFAPPLGPTRTASQGCQSQAVIVASGRTVSCQSPARTLYFGAPSSAACGTSTRRIFKRFAKAPRSSFFSSTWEE
jgi:hypothetical protein